MLFGPGPKDMIRSMAPIIARFFMNMIICICWAIGSSMFQKACSIMLTGIIQTSSINAPRRARYPIIIIVAAASSAMIEMIIARLANGTSWEAA